MKPITLLTGIAALTLATSTWAPPSPSTRRCKRRCPPTRWCRANARRGPPRRPTNGLNATAQFITAWHAVGLEGTPTRLAEPTPADLPLAGWQADHGWFLLQGRSADGAWRGETLDGAALSLATLDNAECLSLPRHSTNTETAPRAFGLVRRALFARKGIFIEAVLATALVNLLTLGTSLYSMQIFDRVIPNQGFQTLWVLTVGVALAVGLEFLLKQVRSHMVDRTCNVIDHELSEWFFGRMLGIRMEARPASVGTLASQVKGFEMVRGVLASISLFVLADVPFALFFILVIFLVGGWLALVPLIALPIALAAGLMFQHVIQKHTRDNLAGNNRKAGLLPLFTRLLMVKDGRIVMDGPRDEVMAKLSGKA